MTKKIENPQKALKAMLDEQGLPMPEIPKALLENLKQSSDFIFSTRDNKTPSPYDLMYFVNELQNKEIKDYIVVGIAGHGTSSWALHFYLVEGSIAFFLQSRWGDAIYDSETTRDKIIGGFEVMKFFYSVINEAKKSGKLAKDKQLVIIESDFLGRKWAWRTKGSKIKDVDWKTEEPTLVHALNSISK